jgi:hypothetical protein
MIDSIRLDEKLPGIVVVQDVNGAQIRYRMGDDGVLRPGRVWMSVAPDGHTVTFFIPFPDGPAEVLAVREP